MEKSRRKSNTIPHNALCFDSVLSGMVSKKMGVQEDIYLPAPFFEVAEVYFVSLLSLYLASQKGICTLTIFNFSSNFQIDPTLILIQLNRD